MRLPHGRAARAGVNRWGCARRGAGAGLESGEASLKPGPALRAGGSEQNEKTSISKTQTILDNVRAPQAACYQLEYC